MISQSGGAGRTTGGRIDRQVTPFSCPYLLEFAREQFRTVAQKIEMVGPVLHHAHPFVLIFTTRVSAPHGAVLAMGKLALDRVGMPQAHFVQERRRPSPGSRGRSFPPGQNPFDAAPR